MTRRERLMKCYSHEELDRPAVYSRTGFPGNDPSYDKLKAYLQDHSELKTGWGGLRETPYQTEYYKEPHSEDFERHIAILHTPKGDLQCSTLASLKGQPGMAETYFLKNRKDAEKYLSLPLPEVSGDVSSFFDAKKRIGDDGIVDVSLGMNPGGSVASLFGTDEFAIMSVMDRDILHELCQREMKKIMNRLNFMLDNKIGPFFSMAGEEYIVPPIHGPIDFYDFNVKYDKPIIDLIHNSGGYIHIHCHGSVKKVFQGFIDMGVDVTHPFEAPPMGDITPHEAKELARGKMCLEGNIQINRMYEATPEEVREETEMLIQTVFDDHKDLILCPTASPYIRGKGEECFPQYKAMIDTVIEWNK
ncbi:MAG: Uroporphyrinogen deCOase protein [Candidatus Poribacteria bacterium]|nr:Uroporphyrinogen deCOase protein [Candidatus Poribacteria bacterium]